MTRKKSTVSRWRWSKHFILCTSIYWICTILVSLHFSEYISLILNSSLTVAYFLDFSSNSSTPRSRAMQSTQAAQDPAEGWRVSDCKPRKEQSLSKARTHITLYKLYTPIYIIIFIQYIFFHENSKTCLLGSLGIPLTQVPEALKALASQKRLLHPLRCWHLPKSWHQKPLSTSSCPG
jgi:hypothetical protein